MLEALKIQSEGALRNGMWKLAAAGLGIAAVVFTAGALALGASQVMPGYAALLLSGVFLALMALICMLVSSRGAPPVAAQIPQPQSPLNSALSLISKKAAESPTKTMIAGLAAGAAYGLLDSLEHKRK